MRPMKDSEMPIIGQVPSDWKPIRLKYLCSIKTGNEDTQNADPDGQYPFYVRSPIVERCERYTFDGEGILVAGDGAGAGRVFHHAFGRYAVHQRVYRLYNFRFNSNFIFYCLSNLFPHVMDMGSAQSTVPSMRLPMLMNYSMFIPSNPTAKKIADFLDRRCAEIDALTADIQKEIEMMQEYRRSLITEAVTKNTKGSPESKIKHVAIFQPSCKTSSLKSTDVVTYTPMDCIKHGYYIPNTSEYGAIPKSLTPYEEGDIVFAKVTPCFENGNIAIMKNLSNGIGFGSSELFVLRPASVFDRYLFYWLQNNSFIQNGASTMMGVGGLKRVDSYYVLNAPISIPSLAEQHRIADFLDDKCAEIDSIVETKQKQIDTLAEYRKSLIYEYVTGKKEVV